MDRYWRLRAVALGITALIASVGARPADAQPASFTTLSGKTPAGTRTFVTPACPVGEKFLVSHLQANPEVISPPPGFLSSLSNVRWSVSVILSSQGGGATTTVLLTAIGRGLVHLETSIPAGQALPAPGEKVLVDVRILDPMLTSSQSGFGMFNVHVTGFCGTP